MTQPPREPPDKIIDALRARGVRITKARASLIEIFRNLPGPISAQELTARLEALKVQVNKTTIYRELGFLMEAGLIREIDLLDGRKRYEFRDASSHHHHLVCTECHQVQCVELPDDLTALERKLTSRYGFEIKSHVLEFFGVCSECGPA